MPCFRRVLKPEKLVSVVEDTNIRKYSHKMNKLQNIYTIGRGAKNIAINKWVINYFKIKIILFIINFKWNYAIHYGQIKVQKKAPISNEFTIFNWGSVGYIWHTICS